MYELRLPAVALRPYVESYWLVSATEVEPIDLRVDVFVDGRADLVMTFGAPYLREVRGGPSVWHASPNLDAQRLVPIAITQRGRVCTSGVRFHLGGLAPFVRTPLRGLTGRTPPPAEVWGEPARALERALAAAPDVDAQAALYDAFLLGCLELDEPRARFARGLEALVSTGGNASVDDAAGAAGVSPRHLERLFARCLGIAPKTTGRILRFQAALKALMRDPGVPLAEVASAAGYFDQAHFVRDFKRMTGGGVPRGYRGYYPPQGPSDFAPNVVVFVQDPVPG